MVLRVRKCQRQFRSKHPDCQSARSAASRSSVTSIRLSAAEELVGLEAEGGGTAELSKEAIVLVARDDPLPGRRALRRRSRARANATTPTLDRL